MFYCLWLNTQVTKRTDHLIGIACISVAKNDRASPNGAVYVASAEYLAAHDFSYGGAMKYVMPDARSLDINEEADWALLLESSPG